MSRRASEVPGSVIHVFYKYVVLILIYSYTVFFRRTSSFFTFDYNVPFTVFNPSLSKHPDTCLLMVGRLGDDPSSRTTLSRTLFRRTSSRLVRTKDGRLIFRSTGRGTTTHTETVTKSFVAPNETSSVGN